MALAAPMPASAVERRLDAARAVARRVVRDVGRPLAGVGLPVAVRVERERERAARGVDHLHALDFVDRLKPARVDDERADVGAREPDAEEADEVGRAGLDRRRPCR